MKSAALTRHGARVEAPEINSGDELWIWCHESPKWGNGLGLTARAFANEVIQEGGKKYVSIERIRVLPQEFGEKVYQASSISSGVIDYLIDRAHHNAYLLKDSDHEELLAVVAERERPLREHCVQEEDAFWRCALEQMASGLNHVAEKPVRESSVRPE